MILAHRLASSPIFVVVEQLNASQWEATCPYGTWQSSGVGCYIDAVADALWMASGQGLGVETVDLGGRRLTLSWPERAA